MREHDLRMRGDRISQEGRPARVVRMSSRTRRVRTTTGIVAVLLLWAVAGSLAIPDARRSAVEPGASITAIGQAAVTGNRAVLEKYVDAEAVARAVYPMVVEQTGSFASKRSARTHSSTASVRTWHSPQRATQGHSSPTARWPRLRSVVIRRSWC
jgi:hypothetical protein